MRQIQHLDTPALNALLTAFDGYQRFSDNQNPAQKYFDKIITSLIGDIGEIEPWALRDLINEELIRRSRYTTIKVVNSASFDVIDKLSPREKEVLKLMAEGHRTTSIQELLGISYRTVTNHKQHLASKLGLGSIMDLQKFAIDNLKTI